MTRNRHGLVAKATVISVLLLSASTFASEVENELVPVALPHFKAIRHYQEYSNYKKHSAFAVSIHGAFASAQQRESLELAREAAITACEALELGAPCSVVSEDGVATGETIDVKDLKGQFRDAQGRIWPAPSEGYVPVEVSGVPDREQAFREYLDKRGYKAFAVGGDKAWGYASGHVDKQQASQVALSQCQSMINNDNDCTVVDINNQGLH